MNILHLCIVFFITYLFSGSPFDDTIFLIKPEDYRWHCKLGSNLDVGSLLVSDISYFYYSSPSFASKHFVNWQYVQQINDLATSLAVEDYLLFKTVLRSRVFWGSGEQGSIVKDSKINFLDVSNFGHPHDFELNFFWLREGWVALDLSRFMCLDRSINLQIGFLPYEVGRGISYGYAYLQGKGFLGLDPSDVINELPPGVLLTGEVFSSKNQIITTDFYCSIIHNHSVYIEEILEPIYANRIDRCFSNLELKNSEFFRGFGHISSSFIWRLIYEKNFQEATFVIEPYILCALIPELNLRYEAEGKTKLVTLGCMFDYWGDRFIFNIEWAINKGSCHIYAWDKNYLNIVNLDGELVIENSAVFQSGTEALAAIDNQYVILNSPKGSCFNGQELGNNLINSKKRFTENRQIDFQGAMFIADFGYNITDCLQVATSFGFATGGEDPAHDSDDYSLGAFLSIQQLYTGLLVQTAFGMGGPNILRPVEQEFSINENSQFYNRIFSDLKYFGYSLTYASIDNFLRLKLNILGYWTFIPPKKFDENLLKKGNDYLEDNHLGTEIFVSLSYEPMRELMFFLAYALFSPGDVFNNANKEFYAMFDKNSFFNNKCNSDDRFNLVYLFNTGFEYYF
jgi:hypothetical protein